MPAIAASSAGPSRRSACVHATPGSDCTFLGSRNTARAGAPAFDSRRTSSLPIVPVLPMTVMIIRAPVILSGAKDLVEEILRHRRDSG